MSVDMMLGIVRAAVDKSERSSLADSRGECEDGSVEESVVDAPDLGFRLDEERGLAAKEHRRCWRDGVEGRDVAVNLNLRWRDYTRALAASNQ